MRNDPQEVIFCFPGSGAVRDWYSQKNFGETKIDLGLFPSLRSIGIDEQALVNEAFQKKFQEILSAKQSLAPLSMNMICIMSQSFLFMFKVVSYFSMIGHRQLKTIALLCMVPLYIRIFGSCDVMEFRKNTSRGTI